MSNTRILLVEDETAWQLILTENIETALIGSRLQASVDITTVLNFNDAWQELNGKDVWQLLITDIAIPDYTAFPPRTAKKFGIRLAQRAQELQIPCLSISGIKDVTRTDVRDLVLKYGAIDFLDKDYFRDDDFRSHISNILLNNPSLYQHGDNPVNVHSVRIKHLKQNIEKDLELLKTYEDALRYEINPKLEVKYSLEIVRLKDSISNSKRELNDLALGSEYTANNDPDITALLTKMDETLGSLQGDITFVKSYIISCYDNEIRSSILQTINTLNLDALKSIRQVLDAIDSGAITDTFISHIFPILKNDLYALQEELQSKNIYSTQNNKNNPFATADKPSLSIRQRLKVIIPLIPFFLQWEADIEIKNYAGIKEVWSSILAKSSNEGRGQGTKNLMGDIWKYLKRRFSRGN